MYLTSIYNSNLLINLNNIKKKLDEGQNIDDYLKYMLKKPIGNKCNRDGLIIKSSIEIINRNVGSFNLNSDLLYKIQYKANILAPNEGCVLENCHIVNDNEVFYIAQKKNLHTIILIPKNLITEKLKHNTLQTIVCLDKFYEINDNYIFIIGVPIDKSKMNIDKIKLEDNDDEKCKETIKHLSDFKNEYYNLFNKTNFEDFVSIDISDLNDQDIKEHITDDLLITKNKLIEYIKLNQHLDYVPIDLVENTNNLKDLMRYADFYGISIINDYQKQIIQEDFDETKYNDNLYKYDEDTLDKIEGIRNGGFYCYMISVIQALKTCKLFRSKLHIENETNDTYFLKELQNLLNEESNNIYPFNNYIQEEIDKISDFFDVKIQQDASEFFNLLLQTIFDTKSKQYTLYDYSQMTNTPNIQFDTEYSYLIEKMNINESITNLQQIYDNQCISNFCNYVVVKFNCKHCRLIKYKTTLLNMLTLRFADGNIRDCLYKYFYTEILNVDYKCEYCKNIDTTYSEVFIHIPDINYLYIKLNREYYTGVKYSKSNDKIHINPELLLNIINLDKSETTIVHKTIRLDLKSIIYHKGTLSSGHYYTANKNYNDFTIFNDHIKESKNNKIIYEGLNDSSNDFTLDKPYCFIYQANIIYDLPFSDITLLNYEDKILDATIKGKALPPNIEYIEKTIAKAGVKLRTVQQGGSNIITELLTNDKIKLTFDDKISILKNFIKAYDDLKIKTNIDDINDEDDLIEFLQHKQFNTYKNNFYKFYLDKIFTNYENENFKDADNIKDLLEENITMFTEYNIFTGSIGYDTPETNHWDTSYELSANPLDLYSEHFNSIEINESYYNDNTELWNILSTNLDKINKKINISLIFNKNISDYLYNSNQEFNTKYENISEDVKEDFKKNIKQIFDKYWKNYKNFEKYIKNILFKCEFNFECNYENINKIKVFSTYIKLLIPDINLVFEFDNDTWYNDKNIYEFFVKEDLSMTININKNIININKKFKINYIKIYGSINKYYGSNKKNLLHIIKLIKEYNLNKTLNNINILNKLEEDETNDKQQYIYFNNIEGDFEDNRYSEDQENTNLPTAIYEGLLLRLLLEKINLI